MNRTFINGIRATVAAVVGGILLAGCQTTDPGPSTTGASLPLPVATGVLSDAQPSHGLRVTVEPDILELVQGQLLTFDCLLHNVGPSAIKLPSSPRVLLTCLYPDGTRFFGLPTNHDGLADLGSRVLRPGETVRRELLLDTQKLHRPGLVELQAMFTFEKMNPEKDRDAWLSRALSNRYGFELRENTFPDSAPSFSATRP